MNVLKKRAVFAEIHQDTRGAGPHIFSVKYRKKDGRVGYKARVSKSFKRTPGESGYRQNVNLNSILLLYDQDTGNTFEIKTDLMVEYNNYLIDHIT